MGRAAGTPANVNSLSSLWQSCSATNCLHCELMPEERYKLNSDFYYSSGLLLFICHCCPAHLGAETTPPDTSLPPEHLDTRFTQGSPVLQSQYLSCTQHKTSMFAQWIHLHSFNYFNLKSKALTPPGEFGPRKHTFAKTANDQILFGRWAAVTTLTWATDGGLAVVLSWHRTMHCPCCPPFPCMDRSAYSLTQGLGQE